MHSRCMQFAPVCISVHLTNQPTTTNHIPHRNTNFRFLGMRHRLSLQSSRPTAHLTNGPKCSFIWQTLTRYAYNTRALFCIGVGVGGGPRAPKTSPREPQNTIKSIFRSQTLIFRKPSSRHHKIKVFEGRRVSLRAQNRHQEARREGK